MKHVNFRGPIHDVPLEKMSLGQRKNIELSLYIGFGTWKNSEISPVIEVMRLEKFTPSPSILMHRPWEFEFFFFLLVGKYEEICGKYEEIICRKYGKSLWD